MSKKLEKHLKLSFLEFFSYRTFRALILLKTDLKYIDKFQSSKGIFYFSTKILFVILKAEFVRHLT